MEAVFECFTWNCGDSSLPLNHSEKWLGVILGVSCSITVLHMHPKPCLRSWISPALSYNRHFTISFANFNKPAITIPCADAHEIMKLGKILCDTVFFAFLALPCTGVIGFDMCTNNFITNRNVTVTRLSVSATQRIVHVREPSNTNLGIFALNVTLLLYKVWRNRPN